MNVNPDPFARFRRDHALVLSRLDELEHQWLLPGSAHDEAALRAPLALLERQFATHMAAEDAALYPAIHAAFPTGRATLESLGADHAELRLMLATLLRLLDAPAGALRDEQVQVVLRDFVDLLRLHIHREESAVFDVASRVLSTPEAEALAQRIAPAAESHPPGAAGPGSSKGTES